MDVSVRPLEERDLAEADRVFRLAFGTFIRLPDPLRFAGDSDWIATRWRADPSAAFAAEADGRLVGSNFATRWGSVAFFGPLSVHPDLWDRGIARRLLEPTMARFADWGTTHAGLYTFAESPKHVALYRRFGFYPRFLVAVAAKSVDPTARAAAWSRWSASAAAERAQGLAACRALTDAVYAGLDVTREIEAVAAQRLGETVLLWEGDERPPGARVPAGAPVGIAVCHAGRGSEAGSGACYVKFGVVRPGPGAAGRFERLLDACEALAGAVGAATLTAGVNLACEDAYRRLCARGFRTVVQGVAMHRPNEPGYHRPDVYVIDDWR